MRLKKLIVIFLAASIYFSIVSPSLAKDDITPPVIESLEVSPNKVKAGAIVQIKAVITDEDSGVLGASVFFQYAGVKLHYDSSQDAWIGAFAASDKLGTWEFQGALATDKAGNSFNISRNDITKNNLDKLDFFVQSSNVLPSTSEQTPASLPNLSEIKVFLNGNPIYFEVQPFIEKGRTLVPFRAIGEALGAKVDWDPGARKASARHKKFISLIIGSRNAFVDGKVTILDVPPKLINDRTIVPLRFVCEAFGAEVTWNGQTRSIFIFQLPN